MPPPVRSLHCLRVKRSNAQTRCASTHSPPPPPRPYKAAPARTTKHPPESKPASAPPAATKPSIQDPEIEERTGPIRYFWPFSKGIQKSASPRAAPDPARGREAAEKVVETGELDPRYKDAAFKVTAAIAAMPLVIYLGYVLFQRRFGSMERQPLPRVKSQHELRRE